MVHLINNLVESDDNVELVDSLLKMPNFKQETSTTIKNTFQSEQIENVVEEEENTKNMQKFYEMFQNENQKI